jgi:adenylosuccinate synthase
MPVTLVIGTQWGDEGKGKIIDSLSKKADFVVRYQGGNNAGHTVTNHLGTFKLCLTPAGILSENITAFITNGVVLDLEVFIKELEMLSLRGIKLQNRLFISPRCHIILPYHKSLDRLYEEAKGKNKVGTTGRGIGPVYADKVSYNGIRISDFLDKKVFLKKLEIQLSVKNKVLKGLGGKGFSVSQIEKTLSPIRKKLSLFVKEPYPLLQIAIKENKNILIEGAQAMFLDNDWGTYPFVTASTVVSGGLTAGAGISPKKIEKTMGVVKAYATRVGEGPFPTELKNLEGKKLQEIGVEVGTNTGRERRCGWLDLEMVRFAAEINGLTALALTKLDVLDNFETIKICIGYTLNGKKVRYYDGNDLFLNKVKPIYKTMKGWKKSIKKIKSYEKLPLNAKAYIKEIEKQTGISVKFISTGPSRDEIIER